MYEDLLDLLKSRSGKLAAAESCTGGMVSAAITDIPGISEFYQGSVISYANAIKINLLGVPEDILNSVGAVSEECAHFMAAGAARALGADYAVSTTGIAGPGGAVPGKPVGTVCMGFYIRGKVFTETNHFTGSRAEVRCQATCHALNRLMELIRSSN